MSKIYLFILLVILVSVSAFAAETVWVQDTAEVGSVADRWATTGGLTYSNAISGVYSTNSLIIPALTPTDHAYSHVNASIDLTNMTVYSYFYDELSTTSNILFGFGDYGGGSAQTMGIFENDDNHYVYLTTTSTGFDRTTGWKLMGAWCNGSMTRWYIDNDPLGTKNLTNFANTTDPCDTTQKTLFLQNKGNAGRAVYDNATVVKGDWFRDVYNGSSSGGSSTNNSVNFTFPASDYQYYNYSVILRGQVTNNSPLDKLWWYESGTSAFITLNSTGGFNVSIGTVWTEGVHNITVNFNQTTNSTRTNATRLFVYDSIKPFVNFGARASNDTTTYRQNWVYANFSVSDTNYNYTNITLGLFSGGTYKYNTSAAGNYTNFTGLADGKYSINATVSDLAGNINRSSTRQEITLDTTGPLIIIRSPGNNSHQNNVLIPINYTVSESGGSCKWTKDKGLTNVSLPGCINITGNTWVEGVNNVTVYATDTLGNENSSSVMFIIDTVNPVLNYNFANGTVFFGRNITGQFNFSDDNLYRWNVSIDGRTVDNRTNVSYKSYIYNLSVNPLTLSPGIHNLTIEIADSHTALAIDDYDVSTGLVLSNKIEFDTKSNNILIEPLESKMFDVFTYEKKTDRYTFRYDPATYSKDKHYSFVVYTDLPLEVMSNPETKYKKWIISGNNWIDFYSDNVDMKTLKITKQTLNSALVEFYALTDNYIDFQSIGDLNVYTANFTFYTVNYTVQYISPVIEGSANNVNVTVNFTDSGLGFNDINASFVYNNTHVNFTKSNPSSGIMLFTVTTDAPDVTSNTQIQFRINMNVSSDNSTLLFNQSVINMGLTNCSDPSEGRMITFRNYDEETLAQIMNFSLNIDFFVYTNSQKTSYAVFPYRFSNENNYSICVSPNETTLIGDANMEYFSDTYSNRKYFLLNLSITNSSTNLSLYSLLDSQSTDVTMYVIEQSTAYQVKDAYVKILRYYPGENAYRTVEIEKTDNNGQTLSKQVLADVWYKYIIEKPAGTIRLNSDIEKLTSNNKYFYITSGTPTLTTYNQLLAINYNVSCTKSTNTCRFVWSNPTNEPVTGRLTVYQDTGLYRQRVYTQEVTSAAATISYTITDTTDGKKYIAEGAIIQ